MHLAECNIISASCYQPRDAPEGERAHTNRGLTERRTIWSQDDAPIESVLCSKALLSPLPTAAGSKCLSADSSSLRSDPKGVIAHYGARTSTRERLGTLLPRLEPLTASLCRSYGSWLF
jgi:hypothetical protein